MKYNIEKIQSRSRQPCFNFEKIVVYSFAQHIKEFFFSFQGKFEKQNLKEKSNNFFDLKLYYWINSKNIKLN
jgi:hypothetical protein